MRFYVVLQPLKCTLGKRSLLNLKLQKIRNCAHIGNYHFSWAAYSPLFFQSNLVSSPISFLNTTFLVYSRFFGLESLISQEHKRRSEANKNNLYTKYKNICILRAICQTRVWGLDQHRQKLIKHIDSIWKSTTCKLKCKWNLIYFDKITVDFKKSLGKDDQGLLFFLW